MRLFPGAIFMSADDQTGAVMRFDVLSLDLSPDKRLAVLAASKYPPGTTVSPLRDNSTTITALPPPTSVLRTLTHLESVRPKV
jgi:hypothetical protein